MDSLVGSDNIIRIVADRSRIHSGYLYAWLSNPLARALIEQQTYGAVIPHIKAHHVMDLPIPRLDAAVELYIHELIERAAALKAKATSLVSDAQTAFLRIHSLPRLTNQQSVDQGTLVLSVPRSQYGQFALTTWTYNPVAQRICRRSSKGLGTSFWET